MNDVVLSVKDVSFAYEKRKAIENITFDLHQGEMLGLVGQNGSGKSTLLKVILGLLPLQSGQVYWFGRELADFHEWSRIGYVSQKANSFNSGFPATVYEVVAMGLTGKLGLFRRVGRQEKNRIFTTLETVGMADLWKQNIGELSGGQQQRVFIARALVSRPEVLILDEPTVGVDAQHEKDFYELLKQLNKDFHLSIILVSHDLGVVSEQMDTIACLNRTLFFHGQAAEFSLHSEEILQKAYGKAMHLLHHQH